MLRKTQVEAYRLSSGRIVADREEAVQAERRMAVYELLDLWAVGVGGGWTKGMFADFLVEHAEEVHSALFPTMSEPIPYVSHGMFGFNNDPGQLVAVTQYREAMLADDWSQEPTYPNTEPVERAARLTRDGYVCLMLCRDKRGEVRPRRWDAETQISFWGPDAMAIDTPQLYSWDKIRAGLRTCLYCDRTDVDVRRVGFAGRCCATCYPEVRSRVERPGWDN